MPPRLGVRGLALHPVKVCAEESLANKELSRREVRNHAEENDSRKRAPLLASRIPLAASREVVHPAAPPGIRAVMKAARLRPFALLSASLALLPATGGCSKLKAALGRGGDAGAEGASAGLFGPKGGPGPLAFLNGFEGEIDVLAKGHFTSKGAASAKADAPMTVAILMKGGKLRVDPPAGMQGMEQMGKGYAIYDTPDKKLYIVMEAQKQAILIDLNKTGEHLKGIAATKPSSGGGGPSKPSPKVTKTGKTDTVAGYTCELWDITDESSKGTMCIAEEGLSFFHIPLTGAPAEYAWMAELVDGKHLPLRFVAFDKAGTEEGRVEVTKIDKKTEAATQFEVPAGYKIIPLEQMFQMPAAPAGGHVPFKR